ncbi:MAG TPA: protein kinase [Burkholderiales bacterium]|nr:protein kinase [Burkholderiales bacterium]
MTQQSPLERYQIFNEVGRGAIGRVYAARDRSTGALVALKMVDPALFGEGDAQLAEAFLENARSAARLKHRNIVKVLDAGVAGGTAYVAMELLVGESLRQALDKRPLPVARAVQILDDVASALAYAHEEGVVHRGIKPSNIIILRSGVAKIGDFGIGQIGEAAVRYKSPEQVRGDPIDHRSDLFSLGTVFYEMLTGRPLFEGASPQEIMENILRAEAPAPSEVNPHVPGAVEGIVSGMLRRNPDERFASARILLRELQGLKEGLGLAPGGSARTVKPIASAPARTEPTLRTPDKTSSPARGQAEPAAPETATEREPSLRTPGNPTSGGAALDEQDARFMMERGPLPYRPAKSRVASFAAFAFTLVAVVGVAVWLFYSQGSSESPTVASRTQEGPAVAAAPAVVAPPAAAATPSPSIAPAPVPEPINKPAPAPVAEEINKPAPAPAAPEPNPLPPKPLTAKPSAPAQPKTVLARESKQAASADTPPATPPAQKLPRVAPRTASISEPQPGAMAKLIIAVSPQGELYVDGKHYGTTPPITTLDLEPGMHRIEIRSGSRRPYVTYMTLQAGDVRRIRHEFGARPSGPPT